MEVPLLDLRPEFEEIRQEVLDGWNAVFQTMRVLKGPNLQAFEKEMADYLGVGHVVGVASGTDALALGLIAAGVGPGHEVVIQANAFAAAVEATKIAGATPVAVDIREEDLGPDADQVASAITPRTKAVIVVHMYGLPVDLAPIVELCRERGLVLVEDASHAHGAEYRGKKIGAFGTVGAFSCGPVKNLACIGDGGFVATDDPDVAQRVRLLQAHGQAKKNQHALYGFNSRLDELQAVVLRAKLKRLDERNARRRELAARYDSALAHIEEVTTPPTFPDRTCAYHRYVVRVPRRDELAAFLKERGVGTGIYYPVPIHKQPPWKETWGTEPSLPVAEKVCGEILALPLYPELTDEQLAHVVESIEAFFA